MFVPAVGGLACQLHVNLHGWHDYNCCNHVTFEADVTFEDHLGIGFSSLQPTWVVRMCDSASCWWQSCLRYSPRHLRTRLCESVMLHMTHAPSPPSPGEPGSSNKGPSWPAGSTDAADQPTLSLQNGVAKHSSGPMPVSMKPSLHLVFSNFSWCGMTIQ
jgi:hypothetical protein